MPLPWSSEGPAYGFGAKSVDRAQEAAQSRHEPQPTTAELSTVDREMSTGKPWLPQPPEWKQLSVEAQVNDAGSMLALYRTAIGLRRTQAGLGDGELSWLEPDAEPDAEDAVVAFQRGPGFACVVNLGARPAELPAYEEILLASESVDEEGRLPTDAAVWLRLS